MKKIFHKYALVSILGFGVTIFANTAFALPFVTGGVTLGGTVPVAWTPEDNSGNQVAIPDATFIDFSNNTASITGTGSFSALVFPDVASLKDFSLTVPPTITSWWEVEKDGITYSFDLVSVAFDGLTGNGWLNVTGYDPTPAAWTFSGDSSGSTTFGFSATNSPVPEPATMLLFGAGLAGLAGIQRKRKS